MIVLNSIEKCDTFALIAVLYLLVKIKITRSNHYPFYPLTSILRLTYNYHTYASFLYFPLNFFVSIQDAV